MMVMYSLWWSVYLNIKLSVHLLRKMITFSNCIKRFEMCSDILQVTYITFWQENNVDVQQIIFCNLNPRGSRKMSISSGRSIWVPCESRKMSNILSKEIWKQYQRHLFLTEGPVCLLVTFILLSWVPQVRSGTSRKPQNLKEPNFRKIILQFFFLQITSKKSPL